MRLILLKELRQETDPRAQVLEDGEKWKQLENLFKTKVNSEDKETTDEDEKVVLQACGLTLAARTASVVKDLKTLEVEQKMHDPADMYRILWKANHNQNKQKLWTFDDDYLLPFQKEKDAEKRLQTARQTYKLLPLKAIALYNILTHEFDLAALTS